MAARDVRIRGACEEVRDPLIPGGAALVVIPISAQEEQRRVAVDGVRGGNVAAVQNQKIDDGPVVLLGGVKD